MRYLIRLMTSIGALSVAAPASAQDAAACRLRIDLPTSNWVIRNHDPFALDVPAGQFEATFTNEGSSACAFRPQFVLDREEFGLQSEDRRTTVEYALVDMESGIDLTPRAGRSVANRAISTMEIDAHSSRVMRFRLVISPDAPLSDGLFSQQLAIEAEDDSGRLSAVRRLLVGLDVPASAQIGLSGAYTMQNGYAVVDLGRLQEGLKALPLQLRVSSTRGYRLDFMASGALSLPGTAWRVPYTLVVDGKPLEGAGWPKQFEPGLTKGGRGTDSLSLAIVLASPSNFRAGRYSDEIEVTVSPR